MHGFAVTCAYISHYSRVPYNELNLQRTLLETLWVDFQTALSVDCHIADDDKTYLCVSWFGVLGDQTPLYLTPYALPFASAFSFFLTLRL